MMVGDILPREETGATSCERILENASATTSQSTASTPTTKKENRVSAHVLAILALNKKFKESVGEEPA
jgi:hypothetical protein